MESRAAAAPELPRLSGAMSTAGPQLASGDVPPDSLRPRVCSLAPRRSPHLPYLSRGRPGTSADRSSLPPGAARIAVPARGVVPAVIAVARSAVLARGAGIAVGRDEL
jgi:hypothetical protein